MKFTYPAIDNVFDTECGKVNTLIIENPPLFMRLLTDLHAQLGGLNGESIVSVENMPVACAKHIDIIDKFIPFGLNRRPLINKVVAELEKRAVASDNWVRTSSLLREVSEYIEELAFDFPCDIVYPDIAIGALLKAAGIELREEYESLAEHVVDYMELVRTFDRDKLFFTVNMRSYVDDAEIESFMQTVLSHSYHVIMLESGDKKRVPSEHRLIIDEDLCEID